MPREHRRRTWPVWPAWLGMGIFLGLSCLALSRGWADLLAFQGQTSIASWVKEGRAPGVETWTATRERLQTALALDPSNPQITENIAKVYELRALARLTVSPVSAAFLEQSLTYLRRSAQLRPVSPYTWSNIALIKGRLGKLDDEYLAAIDHAARLGAWEPNVQMALADTGFRHWSRLPPKAQTTIRGALQRGLKRQDEKLFNLASTYGRLDVLCATPDVSRSKHALRCI